MKSDGNSNDEFQQAANNGRKAVCTVNTIQTLVVVSLLIAAAVLVLEEFDQLRDDRDRVAAIGNNIGQVTAGLGGTKGQEGLVLGHELQGKLDSMDTLSLRAVSSAAASALSDATLCWSIRSDTWLTISNGPMLSQYSIPTSSSVDPTSPADVGVSLAAREQPSAALSGVANGLPVWILSTFVASYIQTLLIAGGVVPMDLPIQTSTSSSLALASQISDPTVKNHIISAIASLEIINAIQTEAKILSDNAFHTAARAILTTNITYQALKVNASSEVTLALLAITQAKQAAVYDSLKVRGTQALSIQSDATESTASNKLIIVGILVLVALLASVVGAVGVGVTFFIAKATVTSVTLNINRLIGHQSPRGSRFRPLNRLRGHFFLIPHRIVVIAIRRSGIVFIINRSTMLIAPPRHNVGDAHAPLSC